MKHINIISKEVNPELGGIESTAWYLGVELSKVTEINFITAKCNKDIENYSQFKVGNSPLTFAMEYLLAVITKKIKNENSINLCISYQIGLGPLVEKTIHGIPYIVLTHGNEVYVDSDVKLLKKIKYFLRKKILDNARCVCSNSEFTKKMCEQITHNKIHIVNPGVEFVNISCNKEISYNLLSIGRLIERKGFQYVISSLPKVLKKFPVHYYIAGGGPMENTLKNIVKELKLQENVHFCGKISQVKKDELYRKCDVFIMTSVEIKDKHEVEGFGVVYIEANMYGKYVIASETGGCSEAVIDGVTGKVLKTHNPSDIADAIIDYFQYKQFEFEPEKAICWAKEHDYYSIAEKYYNLAQEKQS